MVMISRLTNQSNKMFGNITIERHCVADCLNLFQFIFVIGMLLIIDEMIRKVYFAFPPTMLKSGIPY